MANGGADRSSIPKLKPVRVAPCRVIRPRPGVKGKNMRAGHGDRLALQADVGEFDSRSPLHAVVAEMD